MHVVILRGSFHKVRRIDIVLLICNVLPSVKQHANAFCYKYA
jgi:hypothetical protein